jgi:hypothetical protein
VAPVTVAMPEQQRTDALRRLAIEEADAWFEYLASTRTSPSTATAKSNRGRGRGCSSGSGRHGPPREGEAVKTSSS